MKGRADTFSGSPQIDFIYRMAPSNKVCNCTIYFTRFTPKSKLSLSSILIFSLLTLALAQYDSFVDDFIEPLPQSNNPTDGLASLCTNGSNIMAGSSLERNLKMVLNSLVENVNKTGNSISSHGENGDKMYGLAQCRGDLNASACRECVSNVTKALSKSSGNCNSASIQLNGCFSRYATHNLYPTNLQNETWDSMITLCDNTSRKGTAGNVGGSKDWNIAYLLTRVTQNAGFSNVGFATGNEKRVYSLAQCWRGLTTNQCKQCLQIMFDSLGSCPERTSQGGAFSHYCIICYARFKFYGDGVPLLTASTASGIGPSIPPSRAPEGKRHPKMLEWSIGGAVVVLLLVGGVVFWKLKVMKSGNSKGLPGHYKPSSELSIAISKSKLNYKFETLQIATKNFDPTNKIGEGGFGSVYKGILDGRQIAVKRLFSNREESVNEFFNEVNLISCVQHKNLVKLLGCSVDGPEKLLVYEYLPNKSLDRFLFDENLENALDWQTRFGIILGTASGLAYLHQESDVRIIHRDIKASNILLDHLFKPKIADFGLIKYFSEDQSHVSTRIIGTRGYMAPEYLVHGHLTEKVDVYAFGVLVLEIISGRRNKTPIHRNDIPPLLTMVWNHHLSGTIASIIDPNIKENCPDEILQVVHIALLCTQASAILRPSMSEVVTFLTNKNQNLLKPSHPPYIDVTHLQSNINTNITMSRSKSNIEVTLNYSHSKTNTNISPISIMDGGTLPNVRSSPHNPMSLNTISISSFGPR